MALSVSLALSGGAAALALLWYARKRLEDAREPPSVGRYPLLGSLPFYLPEPLYLSLYERFGQEPIVRVHFGSQCVYVFNRWSAFKAAMVDNAEQLSGRVDQTISVKLFGDEGGIIDTDGEIWLEYRRFSLKTLRDLGFGRRGGEDIICAEAEHMRRTLDTAEGQPVDTEVFMVSATSNVICQLVFGSRLASEDEKFAEILEMFRKLTHMDDANATNAVLLSMIPIVRQMPFLASLMLALPLSSSMFEELQKLLAYCNEHRDRHAKEMEGVDEARDYIESHLLHQRNCPEIFNDTRLSMAVCDLFVAGTDTTASTLRWAVLYMIANPSIAEKVHEEIMQEIGRERLPCMQDKSTLNYTQAVIEEVHRKVSLVPLGHFHRVTDDITVEGVKLRAESICTFNMFAIHHDTELFPDPMRFLPERHLKDGQFVACPYLASFGLGKRACLGESLARMELFIFFVTLMQRYRFRLDPEESTSLLSLLDGHDEHKGKIIRAPSQHKVVFEARQ